MFVVKNIRVLFASNAASKRLLSTTTLKLQCVELKANQVKEVRISVPWGHIAGKWYGPENVQPILMVHGWQDNAGSFDTLIPLLPSNMSYLSIDLPGHGLSSHLPEGCLYHAIDNVPIIERIRRHYKWDQVSLVSHSMGSIVSFIYASIFPKNVNLVCALDTLKIQNIDPKYTELIYTHQLQKTILLREDLMKTPPEYPFDELVQRVHDGSKQSVDKDKAKYLIERGTRQSTNDPTKYCFTRDIRAKFMNHLYAEQSITLSYIKRIQAAYLFIRGEDRIFSESEDNVNEAADRFRKHNKRFEMIRVKGTHHFHLNQPEMIANDVSRFLTKYHGQEQQAQQVEVEN